MALKIARGMSRLSATPARIKAIGLIILAIIGIVIVVPKGNSISLGAESTKSGVPVESHEETKSLKPVQADQIKTVQTDASGDRTKRSAKIVTCPRCRLNALPHVKKFVYEHAKFFEPGLKIDFILGEDPVLHLYEDEKEVEKIDLESYDSKKIIQKLVEFGIKPNTEADVIREALGKS